MKIVQVVNALPSLQKLAKQDMSLEKLYKISKLLSKLDDELAFYNEQRSKIVAQYCDVVDGHYVPRKDENDKLTVAMNELLNLEIQCEIQEVAIGANEDIKLSYNDLMALQEFIRIEE